VTLYFAKWHLGAPISYEFITEIVIIYAASDIFLFQTCFIYFYLLFYVWRDIVHTNNKFKKFTCLCMLKNNKQIVRLYTNWNKIRKILKDIAEMSQKIIATAFTCRQ